jgi:transketolase
MSDLLDFLLKIYFYKLNFKMKPLNINELILKAKEIRQDIIKMIYLAASGHPGSSLSSVEIITSLYFNYMRHNVDDPIWENRDRFVLSKGHGCPCLYAVLAHAGYFGREELWTLRKLNSRLQGHPDRIKLPMIEASTGPLGQGFSVALGISMGLKLNKSASRVFTLLGDGETNEGQIWEVACAASHFKADNLIAFIDLNGYQLDGRTIDIMSSGNVEARWKGFGWDVYVIDGHDFNSILNALKETETKNGQPHMIIAKTTKGKGVSFMENNNHFHGVPPNKDEYEKAMKELSE